MELPRECYALRCLSSGQSVAILDGMRAATRQKSGGRPGVRAWAGLVLAVLGVSGTSTYMKLAGTDPLVTAFWRLALSTLLLLPLQVWRRRNRLANSGPVPKGNTVTETGPPEHSLVTCEAGFHHGSVAAGMLQQLRLSPVTMLAGTLLAVHFALWVTSLSMTSVLSSLVFVTMSPLFVAVLDLVLFRGRTSPLLWVAVGGRDGGRRLHRHSVRNDCQCRQPARPGRGAGGVAVPDRRAQGVPGYGPCLLQCGRVWMGRCPDRDRVPRSWKASPAAVGHVVLVAGGDCSCWDRLSAMASSMLRSGRSSRSLWPSCCCGSRFWEVCWRSWCWATGRVQPSLWEVLSSWPGWQLGIVAGSRSARRRVCWR